jgi:hypothetical protein
LPVAAGAGVATALSTKVIAGVVALAVVGGGAAMVWIGTPSGPERERAPRAGAAKETAAPGGRDPASSAHAASGATQTAAAGGPEAESLAHAAPVTTPTAAAGGPEAASLAPDAPVTTPTVAADAAGSAHGAPGTTPTAAPEGPEAGSPAHAAASPSRRSPRVPLAQPPPSAPLPAEAELLEGARHALRSDPARALALTSEHQRLHPRGLLSQEREVLAIEALARVGRRAEARARAERFLRRHPTSAHRERLEAITRSP